MNEHKKACIDNIEPTHPTRNVQASPVAERLSSVKEKCDTLHKAIDALAGRLEMVLVPEDGTQVGHGDTNYDTDLENRIGDLEARIEVANHRLRDILDRVRL